jgi:hypothetical protein
MQLDPQLYAGPIVVTVVYTLVYYALQIRGMRVKTRLTREYRSRGEKFDRYFGQDREMLASDRAQLNMLEHMPIFLVLLWLNAAFVGPLGATVAGGIYVAARGVYPILMGARLGRGIRSSLLAATVPGYLVIVYFAVRLLVAALAGQ